MERIKIYKVCKYIRYSAHSYDGKEIELAICTSKKYAKKAFDRLVEENHEKRDSLYIVEDEIILNAIYGWDDGDLTEDFSMARTKKKTYYAVCSSYYDNGRVVANLMDVVEADEKPQDIYESKRRYDVYVEWFDSQEEAMKHIEECKRA